MKYKVGVFDDNPIILSAIGAELSKTELFEVNCLCSHANEFDKQLEQESLDLVLMDVVAEDVDGLEFIAQTKKKFQELIIVVFSNVKSAAVIKQINWLGIEGFVSKTESMEALVETMSEILLYGKKRYPQEFKFIRATSEDDLLILSPKEKQVLRHIASGKSAKEIAEVEFISENTVAFHRKNLLRKFKINNVAQLVQVAMEFGYC